MTQTRDLIELAHSELAQLRSEFFAIPEAKCDATHIDRVLHRIHPLLVFLEQDELAQQTQRLRREIHEKSLQNVISETQELMTRILA